MFPFVFALAFSRRGQDKCRENKPHSHRLCCGVCSTNFEPCTTTLFAGAACFVLPYDAGLAFCPPSVHYESTASVFIFFTSTPHAL